MASTKPTVYLIDGSGYIFRAYYAVSPSLTNKDGFPTNALFGFTKMLVKLISDCASPHIVVVFDAGRATFRTELYKEYKANREECPEDLSVQMPFFREIAAAMGLRVLELQGFEADDIIGTLTRQLRERDGAEVVVVSGDKDLMQLVSDGVTIWDTMKDKRFGRAEVIEKFQVPPEKVVELLGLAGDSSDNIPGLKGVGPKTAVQLIEKYGDVEAILRSAAQIKEDTSIRGRVKIAEQIELDPEILRLSRRLVEIDQRVPLTLTKASGEPAAGESMDNETLLSALERVPADQAGLAALVDRFNFHTLTKDLKLETAPQEQVPTEPCDLILRDQFNAWLETFRKQQSYSFDLETTSLDPNAAKIVGISFCWEDSGSYYIPLGHRERPADQVAWADFVEFCGPSLEDPKVKKVGQNLKYDISVFARQGVRVQGVAFDTMVAAYLLNPDKNSYNLTTLARDYLDRGTMEYDEVVGEHPDFSYVGLEAAARYCGQDSLYTWLLRKLLQQKLEAAGLLPVFQEIEIPLIPVLSAMELQGVKLDVELLSKMSVEFETRIGQMQERIHFLAGGPFNMNSPKQLAEVLFERLKIPTKGLKRTKTGISTNSSVLEKLADVHELPGEILHYRMLFKLKSTYIDALPVQVSPYTARLHSRFNQTVTSTGRLSSSEPNLQNIPIQGVEGQRIRSAFIAEDGMLLISADYSQIELRILAHLSEDANLIHAFENGLDIHSQTARQILGLKPDAEITTEMRRIGKTINFGVIYGMGGFRLGRELGIPLAVANKYIESYFDQFPGVRDYFAKLEQEIESLGYVSTLFGRKRRIADLDTTGRDHGFARRALLNAPLQGTAADIVKLAMIAVNAELERRQLPATMILQIHDELVFEVEPSALEEVKSLVQTGMEGVAQLKAPLKVDLGSGRTWQEAQS